MSNFIPDTDKTITLPVGIDFREPGQPSPYRDKAKPLGLWMGDGTVSHPYRYLRDEP